MYGFLAAILASVIWGLNPLFFDLLNHVPVMELLAHRTLWAAVFVGIFCMVTGRGPRLWAALRDPVAVRGLLLTSLLIITNWGFFVMAVQAGRVTEAGVGYYLMPLISVALGVFVLGETLSRGQLFAVGLAGVAVVLLGIGLGTAPWLPLLLGLTFAFYGLLRKRMETGAIVGFEVEALLLTPLAVGWLVISAAYGLSGPGAVPSGWFGADLETTLLLMLSGPITGIPLILFAEAARRMSYGSASLVLYLNPTLQILSATLILREEVNGIYVAALVVIWFALGLYSREILRQERASRAAATAASAEATTDK